jgi:hypothetical protein
MFRYALLEQSKWLILKTIHFSAQIFKNIKMDLTSTHPTGRYFIWASAPTICTNLAGQENN